MAKNDSRHKTNKWNSLNRFFIDVTCSDEGKILIEGPEARQMCSVLRLREGDCITVLDGSGCGLIVCLSEVSSSRVEGNVLETCPIDTEPRTKITLAQSLPKGDKLEFIIQKGTELGVAKFEIVTTARTVARPPENKVAGRLERWQSIAKEAAEQSCRAVVPVVSGIGSLEELVPRIADYDLTICLWEEEEQTSLREVLNRNRSAESILLLVGPEGGFEAKEASLLKASGAETASLGKRILRCETAAIAAVAAVLYELEM